MPEYLTSRQRVRRALRHQEVDRVPRDYGANAGIDARLRERLGAADDQALRDALACDFVTVGARYVGPVLHAPDPRPGFRVDPLWGRVTTWVEHGSGGYWDYCGFPLADADLAAVEAWPMPDPDDFDYSEVDRQLAVAGDLAVVVGNAGFGDVMNTGGMLFGMEQMYFRLADGDEAFARFTERRNRIICTVAERVLDRAAGRVDVLAIGEDLGSQRGPLVSHDMFREHVAPHLQRCIDLGRRRDLPVVMHSCGASHHFFDELIGMGVTCMETLQPEAEGMEPGRLKARWGERLAFKGGLSTAGPLANGDEEAVRAEVRRILDAFMPGSGYVFAPTHAIQDDTPAANVVAAYDEALAYGTYR